MSVRDELDELRSRISALEASVRVLLLHGEGPTPGQPSSYTDADAEKAKKAADDYVSRRRDELNWGLPEVADAGG